MILIGNNGLGARLLFETRKMYRDNVLNNSNVALNFWSQVDLDYGKVDFKNDAVYLSESNLKQLQTSSGTVFAADFVVDAFDAMRQYAQKAVAMKRVNTTGAYIKLDPARAWSNVNDMHHMHVDFLYKTFVVSFLQTNGDMTKVDTFETFLRYFVKFARAFRMPVTRTAFILSRWCPPNISGLVIELSDDDKSADLLKQKNALNDPNFEFVKHMLGKFGFYIDKNAPHRIIANIMSKNMQHYMQQNSVTEKTLFENYYYRAKDYDLSIFKTYLVQMWETFIRSYPFVKKVRSSCTGNLVFDVHTRSAASLEDRENLRLWFKVYLQIRKIENGNVQGNPLHEDKIVDTCVQINEKLDMRSALSYLEEESIK